MKHDGAFGPSNRQTTVGVLAICIASACATPQQRSIVAELHRVDAQLAALPSEERSTPQRDSVSFDGSLSTYVAYAYAHSPGLRASFEDWRATTERFAQERRLPEPTITYAGFVSAVETRVGPQQHRLGIKQWFPWPSKLGAGGIAASHEAQATQRLFEAHALDIAAEVAAAYWALWRVHRQREVATDEVGILDGLSEQVRTRVEVGATELSDLAQINLKVSRARDRLAELDQYERVASARLAQVLGVPDGTVTPVSRAALNAHGIDEPIQALTAEAVDHPRVAAFSALSDAARERVREARADRFPSFGIGVDWILIGRSQAAMPPPDSGKDAAAVSLSVKVPLWARAYRAAENEARAHGAASRARALDARNTVAAAVRQQAAHVDNDARRVQVHETTLVPQAEAAFESVLSSYATGRSTVAELLLAEAALLGLQDGLYAAQADYGTHLAQLESSLGRPVRTRGAHDDN